MVRNSKTTTPNLQQTQSNDVVRVSQTNIIGVMGEMAAAKALNLYWTPSFTWDKEAVDVGGLFETRSSLVLNSATDMTDLRLRPTDKPHPHIVCWVNPPRVALMGWMTLLE